jgi:hypothetical protein
MENEAKRCSVPFVVLLFLLSGWVAAFGRPALGLPLPTLPQQPPPVTASQPPEELPTVDEVADGDEWTTVQTFTGEGNETTPPFHISGTEWRITWAIDAEYPEYAAFDLFIYPEGTHSMFTERISYSGGSTGDTVYVYEGGQDYYVKVIAANLRSWTIRVEDDARVGEATSGGEWNMVKTFTGEGERITPSFHVSGTKWRISWTIDAEEPQNAVLDLLIYTQEAPSGIWQSVSYSGGSSGNITYLIPWEGDRDFFVQVLPRNLRNWTIRVEDDATEAFICPVQITHIHYEGTVYPPEAGRCFETGEYDEYVVIKNLGDCPQDMSGWVLKNATKRYPSFTFPSGLILPPTWIIAVYTSFPVPPDQIAEAYQYLVLDPNPSEGFWRMSELYPFRFDYPPGDIWNNEEPDTAVLYNAQGDEVSRKSYTVPTIEERCPVQITRIHYKGTLYLLEPDDGAGSQRVEIDEYVEIRHTGTYPQETSESFEDLSLDQRVQDMSGWVLKNLSKGHPSFTFPIGFLLFPGEIIRIYTHPVHPQVVYQDYEIPWSPAPTHTRTAGLSFNYACGDLWDNEQADIAVLYNGKGEEVSRKSYRVPTQNKARASAFE